ncbi:hypothetical protein GCM10015535_27820 [Streptomyces gelaticus]|uniref:Uncharacterized protein n=1 Tax=Streptomyces gelaticus TaxID=285446 RepID=A0ABQ2VXJ2_9ACTN|nr:hypothetical protein [Streptomyces gelaticus]GGV83901.1 hypothetical protein GCM10015535_27820 [Streptomyces gelaticus]
MRSTSPREAEQRSEPVTEASGRLAHVLGGPWLLTGHDGRLTAYVHVDGAVLRWTESAPGGRRWAGPDVLPAKDIDRLTVVQGQNRYAYLLGRRVRQRADGWTNVDIMYATQYQTGRPVTQWRSLGNPFKEIDRAVETGAPAGTVTSDGALHVCVPTGPGSVALRREDKRGRWEAWTQLQVSGCTDGPAPAATSSGLVEVLVPTRTAALQLRQSEPGGALVRGYDVPVPPLPGSVTALATAPGRLTHYLTDARGSGAVAIRAGSWPVPLGGNPGDGRIAAVRTTVDGFDCTVLAVRGADGTVHLGVCATEGEQAGFWWTGTGMVCTGDPALAADGHGRAVVAAVGADGRLAVARQEDGQGLTLGDWSLV